MRIEELTSDAEILGCFDLMQVLRPDLSGDTFLEEVRALEMEGYRLIAGFVGDQKVTLAGVRRCRSLARGPHAFVNELVTHPDHRGRGYAAALLRHIAAQASANGLPRIYLDSYPQADSFYDKLLFHTLQATPRWIECSAL